MFTKLGEFHIQRGNYDQALSYFERHLRLSQQIGSHQHEVCVLIHIGKVHLICGSFEKGIAALQQALDKSASLPGLQTAYQIHDLLYRAHKHQGNHAAALEHHEQLFALNLSLTRKQTQKRLAMMREAHTAEVFHLRNEIWQEVQARKQAQAEAQQLNQRLTEESAAKAAVIADMDSYSYMVAHDLKAPIAVIMGYSQLLLQDLAVEDISDQGKWLKAVEEACDKMNQIIDSLLMMAKVNSEQYPAAPVNMADSITIVRRQIRPMIEEYNAQILIENDLPQAIGHAPWIEQVWVNYLSNAIKYGGKPPVIHIGAETQDDGFVRYWVRDNGDGIEPDFLRQVFMPFKRAKGHHKIKGHGIGLAIVKRIVEKLGGNVEVKSVNLPGEGCIFSFTLPIAKDERKTDDHTP